MAEKDKIMGYKMNGFSGFGNSPLKQDKLSLEDFTASRDTVQAYEAQRKGWISTHGPMQTISEKELESSQKLEGHQVTHEEAKRSLERIKKNK
jgi:hypothetical protein